MKNKINIIIILIMAVAIGILTYKVVKVTSKTELKGCEKQEIQKLEVEYDEIKKIYRDFQINIDLLERFNKAEITTKDFTNDDKLYIALTHILAHGEMFEESEFDNSDGLYAQNTQVKITTEQIKKVVKILFNDEKYDHLPESVMYEPFLIEFKKNGDYYIGKTIISGHTTGSGSEYIYYLDGYDIKNKQITINVIAGYIYVEGFEQNPARDEGLYKNEKSTEKILPLLDSYIDSMEYYKDQLTNINYVFDINEDGYQLNKITIN